MSKAKVVVFLEGGLVQEVVSDSDIEVMIVDTDADYVAECVTECNEENIADLPKRNEEGTFKAYIREDEPVNDWKWANNLFSFLKR